VVLLALLVRLLALTVVVCDRTEDEGVRGNLGGRHRRAGGFVSEPWWW
jgi:hypothetical protein